MKTPVSTRIELNRERIYRARDLDDIAQLLFPQQTAAHRRAAFMAIFCEIKNAGRSLESTDHIAGAYGLSQSTVTKARAKLNRLGIIAKRDGLWRFSRAFGRSLTVLGERLAACSAPATSRRQREKERFFIELAKGADTDR